MLVNYVKSEKMVPFIYFFFSKKQVFQLSSENILTSILFAFDPFLT